MKIQRASMFKYSKSLCEGNEKTHGFLEAAKRQFFNTFFQRVPNTSLLLFLGLFRQALDTPTVTQMFPLLLKNIIQEQKSPWGTPKTPSKMLQAHSLEMRFYLWLFIKHSRSKRLGTRRDAHLAHDMVFSDFISSCH